MAKCDPSLDKLFSVLGDPTRRRVLERLARGPAAVSELAAPHDMALPSFMAHLKKLEDAGLVASHKEGRTRICALSPDAFLPVEDWMAAQRKTWEC